MNNNSDNNLSRHAESIDDLRALHDKKEHKILSKQQLYASFRLRINVSSLLHVSLPMLACLTLICSLHSTGSAFDPSILLCSRVKNYWTCGGTSSREMLAF